MGAGVTGTCGPRLFRAIQAVLGGTVAWTAEAALPIGPGAFKCLERDASNQLRCPGHALETVAQQVGGGRWAPQGTDRQAGVGTEAGVPPPFSRHRRRSWLLGTLQSQGRGWPRGSSRLEGRGVSFSSHCCRPRRTHASTAPGEVGPFAELGLHRDTRKATWCRCPVYMPRTCLWASGPLEG